MMPCTSISLARARAASRATPFPILPIRSLAAGSCGRCASRDGRGREQDVGELLRAIQHDEVSAIDALDLPGWILGKALGECRKGRGPARGRDVDAPSHPFAAAGKGNPRLEASQRML